MNFLKRGITSIFRQPVKFIILLLLIMILSTIMSGAISAVSAITNTETHLRRQMRPIVTLELNGEAMDEAYEKTGNWPVALPITSEMVKQIADLPQVEYYHYAITSLFETPLLEYVPEGAFPDEGGDICIVNPETGTCFEQLILNNIYQKKLHGTSGYEPIEMREGLITLTSGSDFSNYQLASESAYPVLVSSGFADVNNFSIGSTFTLWSRINRDDTLIDWNNSDITWDDILFDQMHHEFEIVGLFDVVPLETGDELLEAQRQRELANRLYTVNEAAAAIQLFEMEAQVAAAEETGSELWYDPENWNFEMEISMLLTDPLELDAFTIAVADYLPEFWEVNDLTGSFDQISTSMETLNEIADRIIFMTAGAAILIFSLLIMLFLKDRRKEIGIYLALGEKKLNIIFQILFEVLTAAFIGITISIFVGNAISATLSSEMIRTELTRPAEFDPLSDRGGDIGIEGWQDLGFDNNLTVEEMLDAFDTSLDIQTIVLLYVVGFSTVMVSTLIPIVYVLKLEPKEVLL